MYKNLWSTTVKNKKLGTKNKKFKTLSYIKQQSTKLLGIISKSAKFVEIKNENFVSALSDKFCTFWFFTFWQCTKAKLVLRGHCTKS
jgi:hypothetical protein